MRAAIFLGVTMIACAESSAAPIVAVEPMAPIAPMATTPTTTPPGKTKGRGGRCSAKLVAGGIRAKPSCFLDEQISHGAGRLEYPCEGNGNASATFGDHVYEGEVRDGTLEMKTSSELDYTDGCHWTSQQTITGSPTEKSLRWVYAESAVSVTGSTQCLPPCDATADIAIREADED